MLLKLANVVVVPATAGDPGQSQYTYCPPPLPPDVPPGDPPDNSDPPGIPSGSPACPPGFHYVVCCDFGGTNICEPTNQIGSCIPCDDSCDRVGAALRPIYVGDCQ